MAYFGEFLLAVGTVFPYKEPCKRLFGRGTSIMLIRRVPITETAV